MNLKRYILICDLKNNADLISEYEEYHREVWPEIIDSIKESGIIDMEIYRNGTRLVMLMETQADFSFEIKARLDSQNPKVQEWENLMWKYQQAIPTAKPGEKWVLMNRVFKL